MEAPQPLTELQTVDVMIYETSNQWMKCKVLERAHARVMLLGTDVREQRALNQKNMNAFRKTLDALIDIRKTVVTEAGKPAEPTKA